MIIKGILKDICVLPSLNSPLSSIIFHHSLESERLALAFKRGFLYLKVDSKCLGLAKKDLRLAFSQGIAFTIRSFQLTQWCVYQHLDLCPRSIFALEWFHCRFHDDALGSVFIVCHSVCQLTLKQMFSEAWVKRFLTERPNRHTTPRPSL